MQIPERYREKIDPLIAHAHSLLEKRETLATLAFVGNLSSNDIIPVVVDDSTESSKENSARAFRQTATVLDADFIYIFREAWKLPEKYRPRYEELLEE